jgi:hypothetical protein
MERWQNKNRSLWRYLRGWAKNMNRLYKKEKKDILEKLEQLDKKGQEHITSAPWKKYKAMFKCKINPIAKGGRNQIVPKIEI